MKLLPIALAKPYANAIIAFANTEPEIKSWLALLKAASQLVKNVDMQSFIERVDVSKAQKISITKTLLTQILERKLSQQEDNFIVLLFKYQRCYALPNILKLFKNNLYNTKSLRSFELHSAYPISAEQLQEFSKSLENQYKTKVKLKTLTDSSLLGGVVIKEGDRVIDSSIKAKVEHLYALMSAD